MSNKDRNLPQIAVGFVKRWIFGYKESLSVDVIMRAALTCCLSAAEDPKDDLGKVGGDITPSVSPAPLLMLRFMGPVCAGSTKCYRSSCISISLTL
jgi:hypothetical protein